MDINDPSFIQAIQLLKAETLASDWTLSPKRNENLKGAMGILNTFFMNRRYGRGLVAMARQLLRHLEENTPAGGGTIDLLKEILAHIVTFVEQDAADTALERSTCAHCLRRFKRLNLNLEVKPPANKFARSNATLKEEITQLQTLAPHFDSLSSIKQTETMLTIQSLIAEARALQKTMTAPG